MTREQQLESVLAICRWQVRGHFHPLTCGNDSQNHPPLFPDIESDEIILRCAHCDYRQEYPESCVELIRKVLQHGDPDEYLARIAPESPL